MPINKVVFGSNVVADISDSTVTPTTLAKGVTAHDKTGAAIVGELDISPVGTSTYTTGGINKVVAFGSVIFDLTSDTVAPNNLAKGIVAYNRCGVKIVGELTGKAATFEFPFENQSVSTPTIEFGVTIV